MFPNSDDPSTPHPEPRPALALAVAALERALRLVADRKITITTIKADKTKKGKLIKADINPVSGKRQTASVSFSEGLWGTAVQDYIANIKGLKQSDLHNIVLASRRFSRATAAAQDDDNDDGSQLSLPRPPIERSACANIPLNYDSDSDDSDSDAGGSDIDQQYEDEEEPLVVQHEQSDEEDIQYEEDDHPVEDYMEEDYDGQYANDYPMHYDEDGHAPDPLEYDEVRISPAY